MFAIRWRKIKSFHSAMARASQRELLATQRESNEILFTTHPRLKLQHFSYHPVFLCVQIIAMVDQI
jgi:hypothetical protein